MKRQLFSSYDRRETPFIQVYSSLDEINECKPGAVINMSSVLHEIYSYKDKVYIENFWKQVNRLQPEYITIRDMIPDNYDPGYMIEHNRTLIMNSPYSEFLEQFEKRWGYVNNKNRLSHFLLKYRYQANWERELNENYYACSYDDILEHLHENYICIYITAFALPYTVQCAKNDFGITTFPGNTHQKIVFKKRG